MFAKKKTKQNYIKSSIYNFTTQLHTDINMNIFMRNYLMKLYTKCKSKR